MNWDNKELERLQADLGRLLALPGTLEEESALRSAQSFLRYAYLLGKSDGRTEGILSMSAKVSTAQ